MGTYNDLSVYKATYNLLLEMFRFTKDFSKEYKYTAGESLKKETIKVKTVNFKQRKGKAEDAPRKREKTGSTDRQQQKQASGAKPPSACGTLAYLKLRHCPAQKSAHAVSRRYQANVLPFARCLQWLGTGR